MSVGKYLEELVGTTIYLQEFEYLIEDENKDRSTSRAAPHPAQSTLTFHPTSQPAREHPPGGGDGERSSFSVSQLLKDLVGAEVYKHEYENLVSASFCSSTSSSSLPSTSQHYSPPSTTQHYSSPTTSPLCTTSTSPAYRPQPVVHRGNYYPRYRGRGQFQPPRGYNYQYQPRFGGGGDMRGGGGDMRGGGGGGGGWRGRGHPQYFPRGRGRGERPFRPSLSVSISAGGDERTVRVDMTKPIQRAPRPNLANHQ